MKTPILVVFIILLLSCKSYSQISIGAHYSTLSIPAVPFRTGGLGLDVESGVSGSSWFLSGSYFSKSTATDYYNDKYSIIQLSTGFKGCIIGGNDALDKGSLYLGAGVSYTTNTVSPQSDTISNNGDTRKVLSTFTFDFLVGGDMKVKISQWPVFKLFIQSKLGIGLKFIVPGMSSGDALPAMTNLQAGILIPLTK